MKVFIGCSSNYADIGSKTCTDPNLQKIVDFLRKDIRYEVFPWWEDNVLPPGDSYLASFIDLSKKFEFGLFIFGPDDLLDQEKISTDRLAVTRDNVLLECGMFLAVNGTKKTCIIINNTRPEGTGNIPSDLLSHKHLLLGDENIETKVTDFFNRSNSTQTNRPDIYFNKNVSSAIVDEQYKTWGTKALFVGTKSAIQWIAIESFNYIENNWEGSHLITYFMQRADVRIMTETVNNVISIGSGAGYADTFVVNNLKKIINYIPIDINPFLAFHALSEVCTKNETVTTPFLIVDDFEGDGNYVKHILEYKINGTENTNLFLMLGGTFCNLSSTEDKIFEAILSWMKSGDYLLLDTFIAEDNYDINKDLERLPASMPDMYKNFIINVIIKKYYNDYTKSDINSISNNFSEYVYISEKDSGRYNSVNFGRKRTIIDNTYVTAYKFKTVDCPEDVSVDVLTVKRYNFENLKSYIKINLKNNFCIKHSHDGFKDDDFHSDQEIKIKRSRGLFLLQKL